MLSINEKIYSEIKNINYAYYYHSEVSIKNIFFLNKISKKSNGFFKDYMFKHCD